MVQTLFCSLSPSNTCFQFAFAVFFLIGNTLKKSINEWINEILGIRGKNDWGFGGAGYRDRERTLADPE